MIPDYLTFIRFQNKRNLLYIYIVTLILLGFYWKNTFFSFSRDDAWLVSAILALVLYAFIADLKAYWAYKCVVKNVDLTHFLKKKSAGNKSLFLAPFGVLVFGYLIFCAFTWALLLFIPAGLTLVLLAVISPLFIWAIFALLRPVYIRQVTASERNTLKYKRLSHYLVITATMSVLMNLITIAPLRHSPQFDLYGRYFTLESIITMLVLCAIVLAINLIFLRFTRRYIFLGHLFMNEIDLTFSTTIPCQELYEKPRWLRLVLLVSIEFIWSALIALIVTISGWSLWFEVYFLLCYLPCLACYMLHAWWKWHNDFMMSCDMYLRWGELQSGER
ncbi:hypothetical protein SAMN05216516_10477 [Izhakiella capsodis]|uniref:Inner membrane protein n=1 Tax=Izhakiella capsodis TaxID=1367852 RepID=A0A1I4XE69_9GAMM|nr:hypothetical protein [Izhakiella capsodis]SFN23972.1 hypothetical protein SAMN05216516_10477 [Izhakiella capsodis]